MLMNMITIPMQRKQKRRQHSTGQRTMQHKTHDAQESESRQHAPGSRQWAAGQTTHNPMCDPDAEETCSWQHGAGNRQWATGQATHNPTCDPNAEEAESRQHAAGRRQWAAGQATCVHTNGCVILKAHCSRQVTLAHWTAFLMGHGQKKEELWISEHEATHI